MSSDEDNLHYVTRDTPASMIVSNDKGILFDAWRDVPCATNVRCAIHARGVTTSGGGQRSTSIGVG